jgi:crossover junction endodeoxyribonuclease RusA
MDTDLPTVVVLPFPPSVNGVFRRHNGSHLSERYKAWRDEAAIWLSQQQSAPVGGRVFVSLDYRAPDRRVRDLDNLLKAPLDLLVSEGLIEADSSKVVREIRARWVDAGEPLTVTIRSAA